MCSYRWVTITRCTDYTVARGEGTVQREYHRVLCTVQEEKEGAEGKDSDRDLTQQMCELQSRCLMFLRLGASQVLSTQS